ncbi:IS3 family transposase, partial [Brevibacillus halotolerans]|nr:IS3 family transposase [Brevibacillus halotolerans]
KGRYGAPKIHYLLNREGFSISQKKVQRLMIKADIRSITRKKFRPQGSKDRVMERPNLLQQDFKTTSINEKWVADITYIHTLRDGWCYLANIQARISRNMLSNFTLFTHLAERAVPMTMPVSNRSMPF